MKGIIRRTRWLIRSFQFSVSRSHFADLKLPTNESCGAVFVIKNTVCLINFRQFLTHRRQVFPGISFQFQELRKKYPFHTFTRPQESFHIKQILVVVFSCVTSQVQVAVIFRSEWLSEICITSVNLCWLIFIIYLSEGKSYSFYQQEAKYPISNYLFEGGGGWMHVLQKNLNERHSSQSLLKVLPVITCCGICMEERNQIT